MRIKRNDFYFFLITLLISSITVFIYYGYHKVDVEGFFFAIIHGLFASITSTYVLVSIERNVEKKNFSMAFPLLISTVLYNLNSITKYSVTSLFDGYISDYLIRIIGDIYIDLIIIITTFLVCKYRSHRPRVNWINNKIVFIPAWLMMMCIVLLLYIRFVYCKEFVLTRTQQTILDTFNYLVYSLVLIFAKNREHKSYLQKFWPIIVIALIRVTEAILYGGKSSIVKYALIIAIGLYLLDMLKLKYLKWGTAISPIILQLLTIVSEAVSGRMLLFNDTWVLRYHAFRYDLSDYAMTIALRSNLSYGWNLIKEAFIFAIPGYDINVKNEILYNGAYRMQMAALGLSKYDATYNLEDFNDTFFSIGAELLGVIGIFLFFILVIFMYEKLTTLLKHNKVGYALALVLLGPFCQAECDLLMFVYTIRDSLLTAILTYLFFKVISLFRKTRVKGC